MTTKRFTHVWTTCDRRPIKPRAGLRCRIVARGALKTVAIQIEGGSIIVTSRGRIRRLRKEQLVSQITNGQVDQLARIAKTFRNIQDDEDLLFVGFEYGVIPWRERLDQLTGNEAAALIDFLDRSKSLIERNGNL